MPWFKVDDGLHAHPKVRRAGVQAMGLWALAGSYAGAYKTGGRVPKEWVRTWGKTGVTLAARLVEADLWTDEGDAFVFHDWLDYQPSPEQIERDRKAARERQRRRRERTATDGKSEAE